MGLVSSGHKLRCHRGVPTGMSACVAIANIFLFAFDCWIIKELGPHCRLLRRFIDDLFIVDDLPGVGDFAVIANQWHGDLVFEETGWKEVTFLDLELWPDAGGILC